MLPEKSPRRLHFSAAQRDAMRRHVEVELPNEACGLVAGRGDVVTGVFPCTNTLGSPCRFELDPEEMLEIFKRLRADDHLRLAIYHSHPAGPAEPSPTDLAEAHYPTVATVLWSLGPGGWQCRGFSVESGVSQEITLTFAD
ncbi:MAG: hypothetical protein DRQ37_07070 [Gammaproteobacteria bacterium]|nr:MAG: hypothetical protein DRQ37_07070 [Gammaproteobacteria bacterium]